MQGPVFDLVSYMQSKIGFTIRLAAEKYEPRISKSHGGPDEYISLWSTRVSTAPKKQGIDCGTDLEWSQYKDR